MGEDGRRGAGVADAARGGAKLEPTRDANRRSYEEKFGKKEFEQDVGVDRAFRRSIYRMDSRLPPLE